MSFPLLHNTTTTINTFISQTQPLLSPPRKCHRLLRHPASTVKTVAVLCPEDQRTALVLTPPKPLTLKRLSAESLQYESGFLGAVQNDGSTDVATAMQQLTGILSAEVYDVAIKSALVYAEKLSWKIENHIWLKREDLQPVRTIR
ncbi:hypothetical protein vseg_003695 [Gypsophila vaccaria]